MNQYLVATAVGCILASLVIFSAMTKGVKKSFDTDPAENAYQSDFMVDRQSDKASDLHEKTEHLMDDVRAKMERMKRD